MNGWIKIDRSILNHWIWQDEKYFRWWIAILLNVNHEEKKFPVNSEVFICQPGESFRSVEDWSRVFGCSKPTVFKFFQMLESDEMISTKIVGKGNRRKHLLTVVNWNKYQKTETRNFTENFTENKPETLPKINPNKNEEKNKNEKKVSKEEIPDFETFKIYALEKQPNTDLHNLKLKYEAWLEAGWKTGKGQKILKWKSTLLNTLQYLQKVNQKNGLQPGQIMKTQTEIEKHKLLKDAGFN